jgi:hypothetical protein
VRAASAESYGVERVAVEADMQALLVGRRHSERDDLKPRRRERGGIDE